MSFGGGLVSGEAVLLELRVAAFPSRALAKLIDMTLQIGLLLLVVFLLTAADTGDSDATTAIVLVLYVGVIVGYPLLFESLSNGRTLGKLALGLRVVRDDGGSVRFRHSLVRALVGVVEIWLVFGTIAILTSLVSPRGKRVGDYLAGTVVVRERVPTQSAAIVSMPPQLAAWAAGLELSHLPDALALAVRQMLGRTQDLSPQSRAQMAQRMAYEVSRYVGPSPPAGCPPELYLAAVLAERRRRELVRQARQVATVYPIPQAVPAPPVSGADPDGFHPPG